MEAKDTVMGDSAMMNLTRGICRAEGDHAIAQAQAQITWPIASKAGIKKAIKAYTPYIKVLEEENGALAGFASTHGWRSSQVEVGKQCRDKIKRLKAIGKPS